MTSGENLSKTPENQNNDNTEQIEAFNPDRAGDLRELDSIKGLSDRQKIIVLDNRDQAIVAQQKGGIKANGIMSKNLVPDSGNPDIRALFESGAVSITEDGKIHLECLEKGQKDFTPDESVIFAYEPLNDANGNRIVKDGVPQWNIYDCSGATVYEDRNDGMGPQVYRAPAPVVFMPTEGGKVPAPLEGIAYIDEETGELVIPRGEGSEEMRAMPGENTMIQIRKDFMQNGVYNGKGVTLLTKSQGIDPNYNVIFGKQSGRPLYEVLDAKPLEV